MAARTPTAISTDDGNDDDDGTATKAARCRCEVVDAREAARPLSAEDAARSSAAMAAPPEIQSNGKTASFPFFSEYDR